MARIISVINDKGGVSKTTTVMNLGFALWLMGKKVLLVDNDHQCNLTSDIDKTAQGVSPNLLTWMKDEESSTPVYSRYEGLDYIPSSNELEELIIYLTQVVGGDRYLGMRLHALAQQEEYDYILIDCGPGGGTQININALEASTDVIIPIRTDTFSVKGRSMLERRIGEIRKLGYPLNVFGVLLTQYDQRKAMSSTVKRYFQDYATQHPDMPLLPLQIRTCEAINRAHGTQMSIYEYDANSTAADDYMRLAEYLVQGNLLRKKTWTPDKWAAKATTAYTAFIKNQEAELNK